ncbi:DUF397 domain-containing protein [Streptomyces marokkonensis]|uniref:DUF397 domain-containing protein n=1 Tax=Streptomyces marokkonensis TaxID=324855 RepID=UPI0011F135CC|nr:DUF397 domain-containing protein [Streptomyces marokkonensis]
MRDRCRYPELAAACPRDSCTGAPRLVRPRPGWRLRVSGSWAWRKSSRSTHVDNCVEVACTDHMILVRDSKRRHGVVGVTPAAWGSFVSSLSGDSTVPGHPEPGRP